LLVGTAIAALFAVEARKQAGEKEQQRLAAVADKEEAERQRQEAARRTLEAQSEKAEKERQLQRARSALKAALLLRVELVGRSDPQAGVYFVRDEEVYPAGGGDFAGGAFNPSGLRPDERPGPERAAPHGGTHALQTR